MNTSQSLYTAFKALRHPIQLEIVKQLIPRVYTCCEINRNEECSLGEPTCDFGALVDELDISKSSLSLHLKELRHAGLVNTIKDGRKVSPFRLTQTGNRNYKNFLSCLLTRILKMKDLAGKRF